MSTKEYIIVGRDVGQAKYHLVGDNYLPAETSPGGTPLDVVHIGRLIANMSERTGNDRVASKSELEQIRRSLMVESIPSNQLDQDEKDAILDATEVMVEFETREEQDDGEKNLRILVVPVDGTIQEALEPFENLGDKAGFRPPLTYPIDRGLMQSHLLDDIVKSLADAPRPSEDDVGLDIGGTEWAKITDWIARYAESTVQEDDTVDAKTAYLRAVGIYATNMCR